MSNQSSSRSTGVASAANISQFSNVIRPFGYSCMECGYCKGARASMVKPPKTAKDCSKSFGMLAESMTPEVYEAFLYRGWRRSGIHLYKPANFESCCPTLTIRLAVDQFHPTKSQSKIQRKLLHLLKNQHPPSSNENTATAKLLSSSKTKSKSDHAPCLRFESFLRQATATTTTTETTTSIMTTLETETRQALLESSKLLPPDNPELLQTLPSTIISFKIRPPSKAQEKQRQISLASSICAQLAGRAKIARDPLLQSVVAHLRQHLVPKFVQEKNDNADPSSTTTTTTTTTTQINISIQSIEAHSKSGQILLTLQFSPNAWQQVMTMRDDAKQEEGDTGMTDDNDHHHHHQDPPCRHNNDDATATMTDKLADWYQTTIGKALQPDQRRLRLETMPAHQSALLPQVHQLYAQYQHVVHQDPDPFQEQLTKEENKKTKKSNNKDQNEKNNNNDDDDDDDPTMIEDATSDYIDVVMEKTNSSTDEADPLTTSPLDNHDEEGDDNDEDNNNINNNLVIDEDVDPMSTIYGLDWGPHQPSYFKEEVTSMLQDYLKPYPTPIQRSLLNSYYSFYQFLVESPFDPQNEKKASTNDGEKNNLVCGTYHQQYWIGDLLIAVGVVDILPKGLSSVYLYYHPEMAHSLVALGKLAILKEIEYTRDVLNRPYYYLGYYIESCQKMRYKADYQPSQLLCPVQYEWVDCPKAIPKLQQTPRHVCMLVENEEEEKREKSPKDNHHKRTFSDAFLSEIPMDIGAGMTVTLDMLQDNGKQVVRPILQELSFEAGPELSRQCLVKLT